MFSRRAAGRKKNRGQVFKKGSDLCIYREVVIHKRGGGRRKEWVGGQAGYKL